MLNQNLNLKLSYNFIVIFKVVIYILFLRRMVRIIIICFYKMILILMDIINGLIFGLKRIFLKTQYNDKAKNKAKILRKRVVYTDQISS